ncbi:MAG: GGDEF domain-containing protein [Mariprofundaceae bacterium]
MQQHTDQILKDMDALRPFILSHKEQDAELRSTIRRIINHVESIQRAPSIPPERYQYIVTLLSQILDAEHGLLLKNSHELSSEDKEVLSEYVKQRKDILQSVQQDWPALQSFISKSYDLLGKKSSDNQDLSHHTRELERHLREHLRQDGAFRRELNQLISTLQGSMQSMLSVLGNVGQESPELLQAQAILSQELPKDPAEAQSLLQQACKGIQEAGNQLSSASRSIHQQMQQQATQMHSLSSKLKEAQAEARNDPLTGLANRRKLAEFIANLDKNTSVCFIMADIDFFKKINDRYGHDAGDDILVALSQLLIESTRSSDDMVARLGGEEFCIILPNTNIKSAGTLANNLCQAVALHHFESEDQHIEVTISLGVVEKSKNEGPASCLKRADQALYQSKKNGRNRVTCS